MGEHLTPGVYYERVDASGPATSALRTDVTGFVGIARRGPIDTPIPVQSWRQFEAYFGSFTGAGYLAFAVRGFFENGGRRCWVVRVASEAASVAGTTFDTATGPAWRVRAFSPGVWGNDLTVDLRATHRAQTVTIGGGATPDGAAVRSVAGFSRATQVRLSQGANVAWRVISGIDAAENRIYWMHPRPDSRLPYDQPLAGFDLGRPIIVESVEYSLLVRELGRLVRVYEGLSLVPESAAYGPGVLGGLEDPRRQANLKILPMAPEPVVIEDLRDSALLGPSGIEPLVLDTADPIEPLFGGADGLALLSTYDFIGEEFHPQDSDRVRQRKRRGLRCFEDVDEISILAIPDIHIQPTPDPQTVRPQPCIPDPCLPPGAPAPAIPPVPATGDLPPTFSKDDVYMVQSAMIAQCEKLRDRIAVLDPPFAAARDDALGIGAVVAWRSRFDTTYAALYYPWLRVVDPLRKTGGITRDVPPSGHVTGQYAGTDLSQGVHKAPANAALVWAEDVTVAVGEEAHGSLNPLGINAIRALAGRGLRIFGARTLSSDPSWRYVPVRRLVMMIRKAINLSTQWAVFEPNDVFTRAKIRLSLTGLLLSLWERGALAGTAADEAFRVQCDDDNNPPEERDRGKLLAEVLIAPSQPLEFILLRVGRADNEFEVTDGADALATSAA